MVIVHFDEDLDCVNHAFKLQKKIGIIPLFRADSDLLKQWLLT